MRERELQVVVGASRQPYAPLARTTAMSRPVWSDRLGPAEDRETQRKSKFHLLSAKRR